MTIERTGSRRSMRGMHPPADVPSLGHPAPVGISLPPLLSKDVTAPRGSIFRRLGVSRTWLWVLAMLPFAVLALIRAADGPALTDDDSAQYLMHARALAHGKPYTSIPYIFSPMNRWIGPKAAPPGLPFLLAAVQKVF